MDSLEDIFLNPNAVEGKNDDFVYEEPEEEFESPDVRAEFDYDHGLFHTKEVRILTEVISKLFKKLCIKKCITKKVSSNISDV